jgi:ribonuclease P protein component
VCLKGAELVHAELRLRKREDFTRVYRYGQSIANLKFVVYFLPNSKITQFRMGISTSKKIGSAVVRNHVRRLVKEVVRQHKDRVKSNVDFIFIAKKSSAELSFEECEKNVLHIMKKAALFK